MDCVGCGEDSNKQLLGGNTPFLFNHLRRFMKQLLRMFVICRPCCRCHVTNDLLWWGLALFTLYLPTSGLGMTVGTFPQHCWAQRLCFVLERFYIYITKHTYTHTYIYKHM